MSIVIGKRIPLDSSKHGDFQDLARFLRTTAPRWLGGSRSRAKLLTRRGRLHAVVRDSRRGVRHVDGPAPRHARRRGGAQPSF